MKNRHRTLLIPKGILDGNVTNVVLIPNYLEDPNQSLIVRAPAHNRSLPITGDHRFIRHRAPRFASSLDGTPAYRYQPDHMDRDFDEPVGISSLHEMMDDDYYFDMYDSSQDEFVGGDSGDLSGSAMERLLGGELNRLSGAEEEEGTQESLQPPPFMIESPMSSFRDSVVDSAGYEASEEPYVMSHYTPLSQSISVPHASYVWPLVPNCGPCFPGNGGNFELCPQTCPIRRGIPFGDPNKPGDYFPEPDPSLQMDPFIPDNQNRTGPILAGTPPALNRTRCHAEPTPLIDRTGPALNATRPVLNRTGPAIAPALNRTGPVANPMDLNRTRPGAGCLNQTRPIAADPNRTGPVGPPCRALNTTRPIVTQTGSRINLTLTVELPSNALGGRSSRSRIPIRTNRAAPGPQRVPPTLAAIPARRRRQPQQQLRQQQQQEPRQQQQRPQRPRQTPSRDICNVCPGPSARRRWK